MGYGEENLSNLGIALNIHDTKHTANDTGVESNTDDPFADTSSVPNTDRESDDKSDFLSVIKCVQNLSLWRGGQRVNHDTEIFS
jgi:hypothetical protein